VPEQTTADNIGREDPNQGGANIRDDTLHHQPEDRLRAVGLRMGVSAVTPPPHSPVILATSQIVGLSEAGPGSSLLDRDSTP
jgi:hypothetical protein